MQPNERSATVSINPQADIASARITVPEIAARLSIGRLAVYSMLERGVIPAIRLGRRWIITRFAYENWERSCGAKERLAC
jgi:excisionase family DNA binding protein